MNELETFLHQIPEHEREKDGVYTRVSWTTDRLKDKSSGQIISGL